jgi:hypothetical protein
MSGTIHRASQLTVAASRLVASLCVRALEAAAFPPPSAEDKASATEQRRQRATTRAAALAAQSADDARTSSELRAAAERANAQREGAVASVTGKDATP